MNIQKQQFTILRDDLTKAIDVDDSQGRSVPVNMNFAEEGYLIKDTGYIPVGATTNELTHSLFLYEKKNGSRFVIRAKGTKLQFYVFTEREWSDLPGSPTFTAGAEFGYAVYNDVLHLGNAVESLYTFNGGTFTEYASAPKGNILEIFEDRLFISGVLLQPLSMYYSNVGIPTTFTGSDVVQPLGADHIQALRNYYGTLLIFKKQSISKLTFIYDQVVSLFVPKLELQSGNYGVCSKKAVTWVENDIWFFTGREVRSIGYKDQQIGILGVNNSVISDAIKETLKGLAVANYENVATFYDNRRFYLGVPLSIDTNDTVFVCHTLYGNNWTKYSGRDKARFRSAVVVDEEIYSSNASAPYGVIKWNVTSEDAASTVYYLTTE